MGCCSSTIEEEIALAAPVRRRVILIPRMIQKDEVEVKITFPDGPQRFSETGKVVKEDEPYVTLGDAKLDLQDEAERKQKEQQDAEQRAKREQAEYDIKLQKAVQQEKRDDELNELKTCWELLNDCQRGLSSQEQGSKQREQSLKRGAEIIQRVLAIHDRSPVYNALDKAGKFFTACGALEDARTIYERDLQETEKYYGKTHQNTASVLINLGHVEGLAKNHKRKKELLERAVAIQEKVLGPYHESVAITLGLGNLANAYGELGELESKRAALERSLDIYRHVHNNNDELPAIAVTLTWLGVTYHELAQKYSDPKDEQKAKLTLEYALALDEKIWGDKQPDHAEIDVTLSQLSAVYAELHDTEKLKEALERALGIELAIYGDAHPQIPTTLINLANAYGEEGNNPKKKELLLRALALQEKLLGPEAFVLTATLCNLGNVHADTGELDEARQSYERALKLNEQHHKDNINVAIVLGNLGVLYCDLGQYDQSKQALERAVAIKEKHLGIDHPSVALSLSSLAQTYLATKERARFFEFMERAIAIMTLSPDSNSKEQDLAEWKKLVAQERRKEEKEKKVSFAQS